MWSASDCALVYIFRADEVASIAIRKMATYESKTRGVKLNLGLIFQFNLCRIN